MAFIPGSLDLDFIFIPTGQYPLLLQRGEGVGNKVPEVFFQDEGLFLVIVFSKNMKF